MKESTPVFASGLAKRYLKRVGATIARAVTEGKMTEVVTHRAAGNHRLGPLSGRKSDAEEAEPGPEQI